MRAGVPGQAGQGSAAAWSHSVMTASMTGAPGLANSVQLLLRNPWTGMPSCRSVGIVSGCR